MAGNMDSELLLKFIWYFPDYLLVLSRTLLRFLLDNLCRNSCKHQWNTRWAFARKRDTFTRENNILSSHVKRSPLLWLHNKSCFCNDLVFHWCLYNKQNITWPLGDTKFLFTRSLRSPVHRQLKLNIREPLNYKDLYGNTTDLCKMVESNIVLSIKST